MPFPRRQHRNNVPKLRGEKHYMSLQILHRNRTTSGDIGKPPRSNHCDMSLAPVAETGFSHGLTTYKIVGHFFGLSYRKISGSIIIRSKIVFFRISNISVSCPHAQLRGRTVIKKLWTFFGPWGRDRSWLPPCRIFRVKQIHPTTASGRTTRQPVPNSLIVN